MKHETSLGMSLEDDREYEGYEMFGGSIGDEVLNKEIELAYIVNGMLKFKKHTIKHIQNQTTAYVVFGFSLPAYGSVLVLDEDWIDMTVWISENNKVIGNTWFYDIYNEEDLLELAEV